jgi:hypothetical protein
MLWGPWWKREREFHRIPELLWIGTKRLRGLLKKEKISFFVRRRDMPVRNMLSGDCTGKGAEARKTEHAPENGTKKRQTRDLLWLKKRWAGESF